MKSMKLWKVKPWKRDQLFRWIYIVITLAFGLFSALVAGKDAITIGVAPDQDKWVIFLFFVVFLIATVIRVYSLENRLSARYINKESLDLSFPGHYIEMRNSGPETMHYIEVWLSYIDLTGKNKREQVDKFYKETDNEFSETPNEVRALNKGDACRFHAPVVGWKYNNNLTVQVSITGIHSDRTLDIEKTFKMDHLSLF